MTLKRGQSSKSYRDNILKPVLEKRYVNDSSTEKMVEKDGGMSRVPSNL